MNPHLAQLKPYPFERLAALKQGITPPADRAHIGLSIGEPKHAPPPFVVEALIRNLHGLSSYPQARGLPDLRAAIADWLKRRFSLATGLIDPDRHVLPLTGTREGLFALAHAVVDPADQPLVLMPNPFYQIYEGAAYLAGAQPYFLNTTAKTDYLPDLEAVPADVWRRCRLLYLCTPGNPTGAVASLEYLQRAIALADEYDFIIAADECYSEIYLDENNPPPGLLQACVTLGRDDFKNCLVLHSLSKRSNVPGLRSGFVAGDAHIMEKFLLYRTYHGCAMPVPAQLASVVAWNDDAHVIENRTKYRAKFKAAMQILEPVLNIECPPAAFYLWPETPIDDERFTRELFAQQNVTVIPGTYLARDTATGNPGKNRIRISLVAEVDECSEAMQRIRQFVEGL